MRIFAIWMERSHDVPMQSLYMATLSECSTQSVYSAADRVVFKAEGMLMWMDAVLPAYEAAKKDPRLAKAIEMRKLALAKSNAMKKPSKLSSESALVLAYI